MYFIVLQREDGEYELKLLEFGLGRVFHKGAENFEQRFQLRSKIFQDFAFMWMQSYGEEKALRMIEGFGLPAACFEFEEDLPYLARIYEYDWQRPDHLRQSRQDLINSIFARHLGVEEEYKFYLGQMQACAFALPDHLILRETEKVCATIAGQGKEELSLRRNIYMPVFLHADMPDKNFWFEKFTAFQRFYPVSELAAAAQDWVALGKQTKQGRLKFELLEGFIPDSEQDWQFKRQHALLVRKACKISLKSLKKQAQRAYLKLRQHMWLTNNLSQMVFFEAVNSDFNFGEIGERNRRMMQERERLLTEQLEGLRPRIQKERKKAVPAIEQQPSENGTGEAPGDALGEALWAWPIDKLVDYMGPVGRKGRGRKKQKRKKQPGQSEPLSGIRTVQVQNDEGQVETVPEDELPVVPEMDEALVELGWRNSCALFLEEAQAALSLAQNLGVESTAIEELQDCCVRLEQLAEADDLSGQELDGYLEQVADTLTQLRAEISRREQDRELLELFDEAVMTAVLGERAVYGKRYGGLIDHPLDVAHWALINDSYHNRLISGCNEIRIGRYVRHLRADEAIVFYVTFTSLSGYAFDITAHLWRRYEDAGDAPRTLPSDDPHAPMDLENWYDTYVTCFVLHVPCLH